MSTKIKDADIYKVDLVNRGANPGAKILLYKSLNGKQGGNSVKEFINNLIAQEETSEIGKKLDELYTVELNNKDEVSKKLVEVNASLEELKKTQEVKKSKEDILKGLSEEAISIVKSYEARADSAEKLIKKLADERDIEKFNNISKSLNIGDVSEVAKVLNEVSSKCSEETYTLLEKTLKATKEQIEKGELFSERGTSRENNSTTWESVVAKANATITKNLTEEQKVDEYLMTKEGQKDYENFCKEDK